MDVLAGSPDGSRFAVGGPDKKVRIRGAESFEMLNVFRVHDAAVSALAWHPIADQIATGSSDLTIRLWDVDSGARLGQFLGPLGNPDTLAFSPTGRRLGCASLDGHVRLWDIASADGQRDGAVSEAEKAWFKEWLIRNPKEPAPDPEGWVDLLLPLDGDALEAMGDGWNREEGWVCSPRGKGPHTLPLAAQVADQNYRLRIRLRKSKSGNVFYVALPVGDRMTGFELDRSVATGQFSGLANVDGKWGPSP